MAWPGAHAVQNASPCWLANWPAGHATHAVAALLGAYRPTLHATHVEVSGLRAVPGEHGRQVKEPLAGAE